MAGVVRRYAEDEVLAGEPVDAVSMQMMYFLSDWVLGVPVAQLSVLQALGLWFTKCRLVYHYVYIQ